VTPAIKVAGPRDDKGREAHIRECLKRRFDTGKRDLEWVRHFQRLFDLRDAAVHAEVKRSTRTTAPRRLSRQWICCSTCSTPACRTPSHRTMGPRHGRWITDALSRPSRPSYESAAMPDHLSSTEVKTTKGA
jgi:hypothetical protein